MTAPGNKTVRHDELDDYLARGWRLVKLRNLSTTENGYEIAPPPAVAAETPAEEE